MSDRKAKSGLTFVLGFVVYGFTICIVVAVAMAVWFHITFTAPYQTEDINRIRILHIEPGSSLTAIAKMLEQEGYIADALVFKIGVKLHGKSAALKAGEYQFQPQDSMKNIMQKMVAGETIARFVTIREGLTSYEVVQLLNTADHLTGTIQEIPVEGTLLPETYDYQINEPRQDVVARMKVAMVDELSRYCTMPEFHVPDISLWFEMPCERPGDSPPLPESLKTMGDIITLASIVEKETAVPSERKRVAGVFINRLKRGIALQTDPTVIYAITDGKHDNKGKGPLGRRLLKKDLAIDSPYNTYKYPGLPPGPIANPGKASIEAVFNPENHDYIFFVADGSGGHAFAKTLAEHNRNVAKWRQIRRSQ